MDGKIRRTAYIVDISKRTVGRVRDGHPSKMAGGETQESFSAIAYIIARDCLGARLARSHKTIFAHYLTTLMMGHTDRCRDVRFIARYVNGQETVDPPFVIDAYAIRRWAGLEHDKPAQLGMAVAS